MPVEVDFVTMKIAKDHIKRPEATVRLWVDQLEKYEVHYFMRNDANERIFYENDLEILVYVDKLKREHGRSVRMENLAHILYEEGQKGNLKLRRAEDAPRPEPTNQHLKILNHQDIEHLMGSDRVKQFLEYVMAGTLQQLKEDMVEEMRELVREEMEEQQREILKQQEQILKQQQEDNRRIREQMEKLEEALRQKEEANTKQMTELKEQLEKDNQPKGLFAKLFGGK